MFFQDLCKSKIEWDESLGEKLLQKWKRLQQSLLGEIRIPCPYMSQSIQSAEIIGFCDASMGAYAAVIYLRSEHHGDINVRFVAAKTRVAPQKGMTIPRLELLSTLLLSKLIVTIHNALQHELPLCDELVCYTDSKVSLHWILGVNKEWKQFVENHVISIRSSVPPQFWKHCSGVTNPADTPSRGMSASELHVNPLRLNGPEWLKTSPYPSVPLVAPHNDTPEECYTELKKSSATLLYHMENEIILHSKRSLIVNSSIHFTIWFELHHSC